MQVPKFINIQYNITVTETNCVKILSFVYFCHSTSPVMLNKNNKIGQHQY